MAGFISEPDYDLGKVLKYRKRNPVGEDMYLLPDGTIVSDESKIVKVQRIFKDNYYKPEGKGAQKALEKYRSCPPDDSSISK
jgi:predicted ATP-dependent Lon-type protease